MVRIRVRMPQNIQRLRPAVRELLSKSKPSRFVSCLAEVSTGDPQNLPKYVINVEKNGSVIGPSQFPSEGATAQNFIENNLKHDEISADGPKVTKYFYRNFRKNNADRLTSMYGIWELTLWSRDRLEYESDLRKSQAWNLLHGRLIYRNIQLWGYLLDYRYQVYGLAGVRMFWEAVNSRNLTLPVWGPLAGKIWSTFLKLGFEDHKILEQIAEYADKTFQHSGKRWLPLYDSILEHFLVHENGKNALQWHERLFPHHPPGAARFRAFFREVLHQKGNDSILKDIYKRSPYRNIYPCVVPFFCKSSQFQKAMQWHFFLLKYHDLPSKPRMFEPLIQHLAIYHKPKSLLVIKSLQDAGILVNPESTNNIENCTKISGELMNIIHGKTFGVSVKKYNDELGARWFATTWVSLETAISTILALGIRQIGPLSLQAIALRDPTVESVAQRINQLHENGISLGNSLFSKALEHFALSRNDEYLQGLLHSDQHPDELDNYQVQLKLLFVYARARDWPQFYQLLEIQSLTSRNPVVYKKNMLLQILLMNDDICDAQQLLEEMKFHGTPIKSSTISHILARMLQPRRRGAYPCNRTQKLFASIKILHDIMRSGSYVPAYHWHEIIRRIGMLGRLDDLERLSLNLVRWYLPKKGEILFSRWKFSDIPANHKLHPARMLFDNNFQRAVIAWGFIHPLKTAFQESLPKTNQTEPTLIAPKIPDITFGINLLKKLNHLGVFIDGNIVSRAILNRLVTYFGPATSFKSYNNIGQMVIRGRLLELAEQIDKALGCNFLMDKDFPKYLHDLIKSKICKLDRSTKKLQLKGAMKRFS